MKKWIAAALIVAILVLMVGLGFFLAQRRANSDMSTTASSMGKTTAVSWNLGKDSTWVVTGIPPACPEPPIFTMPVNIDLVTAILYPGQVRGDAYKPQGGFRFSDSTPDNKVTVSVPLDAQIVRGSRAFRNGENQYSFELINSCGIWYSLGHLLELTPKFLALANTLPLIDDDKDGFHSVQIFDVTPPFPVKSGEVLATAVGYAKQHNVFFDWGVLDLRHKNRFTISPEWVAKYGDQFDQYAVCGIEMLPEADTARLKALRSSTVESGTKSDYCK